MKPKYRVNLKELARLREWKAKNKKGRKQKLEHPLQYYRSFIDIDAVNSISEDTSITVLFKNDLFTF